jgi:F-type H+-transporting ATPase subunit gamma
VPKPRAILKRRKAVQNIAKITKTMQMIATARFKKAFDRAVAARPYTDRLGELVAELSSATGGFTHPLLATREPKRRVLIAIASNRGLCGGYNSGVLRQTLAAWREGNAAGTPLRVVVAGKKLANGLRFAAVPTEAVHTHFEDKPTFAQVDALVRPFVDAYAKGEIDELRVAYTKFESSARQRPVVERVLPFAVPEAAAAKKGPGRDWIFDPGAPQILTDLIPRTVRLRVFQAFLDAAVSEQVARMTAMKSATDNANDMIKSLGRLFNRSRQSQITTELTEIMGGAAALE